MAIDNRQPGSRHQAPDEFTTSPFDEIAVRVAVAKETKPAPGLIRAMTCTCPAHNDKHPSLLVSEKDDGSVLIHCRAGCTFDEIRQGLGLEPMDLIPGQLRHNRHDDHRSASKGPRFNPWQALTALSVDVIVVALCAAEIRRTGWLEDDDLDALIEAESRIQDTITAGGLRR